jgi:hypothetical protein
MSQLVLQEDFRPWWDRILPGLMSAMEPHRGLMRPEDVYLDLALNQSKLFVCDDGFVIVKREPIYLPSLPAAEQAYELLVWWAYSSASRSVIQQYEEQVLEIAQTMQCKRVGFLDPVLRRGYERVLLEPWKIAYVKWTREV